MSQMWLTHLKRESAIPEVKYEYYREYFNTHFNLSFGVPKTDTCAVCDEYEVDVHDAASNTEKQRLQGAKQEHLRKSQQFYTELRTCTAMARENSNISCISFDFEQNLPLPHIPTNDIFYLWQLWLHVFCVHNSQDDSSTMYSWPETVGHRGANEVVSCLDHYFHFLSDVDTLMLFSDSCGGQNKNSIVILFFFLLYELEGSSSFNTISQFVATPFCPAIGTSLKQRRRKRRLSVCMFQNIGLML